MNQETLVSAAEKEVIDAVALGIQELLVDSDIYLMTYITKGGHWKLTRDNVYNKSDRKTIAQYIVSCLPRYHDGKLSLQFFKAHYSCDCALNHIEFDLADPEFFQTVVAYINHQGRLS